MEETIAVSGELTNINNYRVVLEEILKMKGNLQRRDIPLNTNLLSPAEQVSVKQDPQSCAVPHWPRSRLSYDQVGYHRPWQFYVGANLPPPIYIYIYIYLGGNKNSG